MPIRVDLWLKTTGSGVLRLTSGAPVGQRWPGNLCNLRNLRITLNPGLDLFADDGHNKLPSSRPVVEIEEDNLLPRPERDCAVSHRERLRRPDQGAAQMGKAIAVAPGIIVTVARIRGRELLQRRLQVRDRARLELDCRDARGRPRVRDTYDTRLDPGFRNDGGDVRRDVNHVAEPLGRNLERGAVNH